MASRLASSDSSSFAAAVPALGVAELTLGGDANTGGQHASQRRGDDRFAGPVHRGGVDQVDAGTQRGMDGRDGFLLARRSPPQPESTPTEGQAG